MIKTKLLHLLEIQYCFFLKRLKASFLILHWDKKSFQPCYQYHILSWQRQQNYWVKHTNTVYVIPMHDSFTLEESEKLKFHLLVSPLSVNGLITLRHQGQYSQILKKKSSWSWWRSTKFEKLQSKKQKTTEGVPGRRIVIKPTVFLETHIDHTSLFQL